MIEIEKPRIEIVEVNEDRTYGKFVLEPLERGYGTTLGNGLRRVLLSSLPGAAVSSVKIEGVLHEFSVVPGVLEDVPEIILNIKGIAAIAAMPFIFNIISGTSSSTPGTTENSCSTPSILTEDTAAPGNEDNNTLLKPFPKVVPYPLSKGSKTNFP